MKNRTNHKPKSRRMTGRLVRIAAPVLCVLGIFAVCFGVAGYREKLQAKDDQVMTRGVVDSIGQIPLTKKEMYDNDSAAIYDLGTKENPFLILEVVPYEEFAMYGYHIGGCEPVDMQKNQGNSAAMELAKGLKTATVERQSRAFFFPDEPQADASMYDDNVVPKEYENLNQRIRGYYERVEEQQGNFRQEADGSFVKDGKGNVIWHSICDSELKYDYADQTFQKAEDPNKSLDKIGDRVYTERINTKDDPVLMTEGYYYYKNSENFLSHSLDLSEEEAKEYSVVIKTITPQELNNTPEWADYADLYIFSRKEYYTDATKVWKAANRLGHTSNVTSYVENFANTSSDSNRDINWTVTEKMYHRIMAEKNYAAIIMGSSLYSLNEDTLGSTLKKGCDFEVYDWNLKKTGVKFTDAYEMKSNNNVYRLALMLLSMEPNLFDHLYMDPENPLIQDGKFLLREGEDQEYWSMYTFLLMEPGNEEAAKNLYKYWTSADGMWEKYGVLGNLSVDRSWIKDRFFSYNDDNMLSFDYLQKSERPAEKFTDYQDYLDNFYGEKNHPGTSSDAVRYILGMQKRDDDSLKGNLKILDIEPSYDVDNGYSLNKSYVYMMIPKFKGNIEITHMTTAEFIGNKTDLNSTYQMIYLGLDAGAYRWADQWLGYASSQGNYTTWNDNEWNSVMPGKIYFHTGDVMDATGSSVGGQGSTVEYLWSAATGKNVSGQTLRFAGNDITKQKMADLENFLDAGYPIVAVPYLYQANAIRVDQNSNICKFIVSKKQDADATLYAATDAISITQNIKEIKPQVSFDETPKAYPEYVSRNTKGQTILDFAFSVKDALSRDYGYRIYLDWNQDGVFSSEEVEKEGDIPSADGAKQSVSCTVPKLYVGPIAWKIEVYAKYNDAVRFTKSGFSEAENINEKQKINVLQIVPKEGSYQGALDLSKDKLFTQYYGDIEDYEISVTTMTADEYQKLFNADHPFVFDYTSYDSNGDIVFPTEYSEEQMAIYTDYHLIVMGFGDSYGGVNLSNYYGAVDFLRFFLAEGKSILFTHDQTSVYNTNKSASGYTMNTLMRDLMGMNRYEAVSSQLSATERSRLLAYQKRHAYDTVTSVKDGSDLEEKHGYTYYAMKRLGAASSTKQNMPYAKLSGFNDDEDLTTKVTRVNEGMITQYPFAIDDSFTVAKTHAQTYQLNMEDSNMNVWYCLADDEKKSGSTGITYGVSPNDTANNYYAYNMGNVFYSGIGNTTVTDEMEAKFFINMMVAAYRASYKPPMVEVQNPEAELADRAKMEYRMTYAQEYTDDGLGDGSTGDGVDAMLEGGGRAAGDSVEVHFSPLDFNQPGANLNCSLYYEVNGTKYYIETIYYDKGDGTPLIPLHAGRTSDDVPVFTNMANRGNYYFLYPKKYLSEWKDGSKTQSPRREVKFYIQNDKTRLPGKTSLDMVVRSLFALD